MCHLQVKNPVTTSKLGMASVFTRIRHLVFVIVTALIGEPIRMLDAFRKRFKYQSTLVLLVVFFSDISEILMIIQVKAEKVLRWQSGAFNSGMLIDDNLYNRDRATWHELDYLIKSYC